MKERKISFGVNYVPSKSWYYKWGEDIDEVRADFAAIKSIGLSHIRLQLRWDLFQPEAHKVDTVYLGRLEKILDTAEIAGLEVEVAALTGWLSGFWFLPAFLQDAHIITDKNAVKAEIFFLKELSRFCLHNAFYGLDIGNEINMFAYRDMPRNNFGTKEGDEWLGKLNEFCAEHYEGRSVVLGTDHQPWFEDKFFSRRMLASFGTTTALHTWIKFTGAMDSGGALSPQALNLARFNSELAAAYAEDIQRPINIQEFGISDLWLREKSIPQFVSEFINNTVKCRQVNRVTFWCSNDIDTKYTGFDPLEYGLGLFDCNNNIKPVGSAFAAAAAQYSQLGTDNSAYSAIIIDKHKGNFGWYYGEKFLKLSRNQKNITFVLKEKASDKSYLTARNIQKLIDAEDIV